MQNKHREKSPTWPSGPHFHAHCTFSPHLRAQWGVFVHQWTQLQHHIDFAATLLMAVPEIQVNFKIDVQCAEKNISKIIFPYPMKSWANLTFVAHLKNIKGFENNGAEWPDKHNKTGSVAWPGVGEIFSGGHLPQANRWAVGWIE